MGRRTLELRLLLYDSKGHVVVAIIQRSRIGHRSIHNPSLGLIFGPDEVFNLSFRRGMPRCKFRLPILIGPRIAPSHNTLQLFIRPRIEIDRLDSADMSPHAPMNARATDTNENAQIPRSPSRMLISLAIGTELVWFELEEALDGLLVLRGLLWCSTTRHGELRMVRRV